MSALEKSCDRGGPEMSSAKGGAREGDTIKSGHLELQFSRVSE
jgi:hypothetical protein